MGEEMAFRVRSSKFRHVFGSAVKKEHCYDCIKITKNAHDSSYCAVNPKFVAIVTESAGGGAFLVLPLERTGRVDINAARVCGHAGPVLDIKWNPFNDYQIASCSDDATIKIWQIPETGLKLNQTEWLVDLHGHTRRVGYIEWHPTAENILLSAGYDFKCILWNTETAEPVNIIDVHKDTIFSISWNRDGSLFATTSKDKKIRVIDPREGTILAEGAGHQGSKASKIVFIDKTKLFTTGFSRMSERQYGVWDYKNLSKPLRMDTIDSSSGVLFPYYDYDTKVVFVAGKGDGNIRYYEIVDDAPHVHYLSQYQTGAPQRGLGVMPKRGVNSTKCEIVRFYKLHAVKGTCEPISMIVPRKSEMFQEDIFPPTASACPSLSADEWISGQNREPILVSLKSGVKQGSEKTTTSSNSGSKFDRSTKSLKSPKSPKHRTAGTTITVRGKRESSKDGAISNTPTITTYKAVKRNTSGTANVTTSSGSSLYDSRMKRQGAPPPVATVQPSSPSRLPSSLRNIKKLSVDSSYVTIENNNNMTGDKIKSEDKVSDKIEDLEKRSHISVTKDMTRMTNSNEPLRVDKKVWSSSYADPNVCEPTSNGVSRQSEAEMSPQNTSPRRLSTKQKSTTASKTRENSSSPKSETNHTKRKVTGRTNEKKPSKRSSSSSPRRNLSRQNTNISESDTSELFVTPPSTPSKKSTATPSPVRDSPVTWSSNPLYKQGNTKSSGSVDSSPSQSPKRSRSYKSTFSSSSGVEITSSSPTTRRSLRSTKSPLSSPTGSGGRFTSSKSSSSTTSDPPKLSSQSKRITSVNNNKSSVFYQQNLNSSAEPPCPPTRKESVTKARKNSRKLDTENMLYGITDTSKESESTGTSDRLDSLNKENKPIERTDSQSNRSESPVRNKSSNIDKDDELKTHMNGEVHSSGDNVNNDVISTKEGNSNSKTESELGVSKNYLDGFLMDAPDNTLIKPSKLRESMRKNRVRRAQTAPVDREDVDKALEEIDRKWGKPERNAGLSHLPLVDRLAFRKMRSEREQNNNEINKLFKKELPKSSSVSVNKVPTTISTNKITIDPPRVQSMSTTVTASSSSTSDNNVCTESPTITPVLHLSHSATSTTSSPPSRRSESLELTVGSPPSPSTKQVEPQSPHLVSPDSYSPSSDRLQGTSMEGTGSSEPTPTDRDWLNERSTSIEEHRVHIKKVWSPPITSQDEATIPTENGMPQTDPELRKAYFRQAEEIRSLKEQICLKDKRIRQLEDEVKVMREDKELDGESNC